MDDTPIKHLEFIQNIITRMNTNSFHVKGMSVTITAALLALFVNCRNPLYLFSIIIPTIMFWFLDAYYLQQERKFRGIYNDVAGLSKEDKKITVRPFEMPIQKYTGGNYFYLAVFWSKTIWPFYFPSIIIFLLCAILLSHSCG